MEKARSTTVILFVFRLIPLGLRRAIFKAVFRLFYHASAKQRLIALHNIRNSFPEKSMEEVEGIAKGVFRHIGIVAAEFFELPSITKENLHEWVVVEGLEHVQEGEKQGKGLLSIIGHFGNWELMPVSFPLVGYQTNVVYRPLDSPVMDNLASWVRTKNGNTLIPKGGSGKKIIRLLEGKQDHRDSERSERGLPGGHLCGFLRQARLYLRGNGRAGPAVRSTRYPRFHAPDARRTV